MKTVNVMFFRWLYTFLWSLFFCVPGVVKFYQYRMVPYLVAEYPEKGRREIFALSKKMMDGKKEYIFDEQVVKNEKGTLL